MEADFKYEKMKDNILIQEEIFNTSPLMSSRTYTSCMNFYCTTEGGKGFLEQKNMRYFFWIFLDFEKEESEGISLSLIDFINGKKIKDFNNNKIVMSDNNDNNLNVRNKIVNLHGPLWVFGGLDLCWLGSYEFLRIPTGILEKNLVSRYNKLFYNL